MAAENGLPDTGYIRIKQVLHFIPVSKSTWWQHAYDRAKFLPQRKQMMQEWADYLDKVSLKIE